MEEEANETQFQNQFSPSHALTLSAPSIPTSCCSQRQVFSMKKSHFSIFYLNVDFHRLLSIF